MEEEIASPLLTLIIFTYNQQEFIYDAVNSALAQTHTPLDIIFSDDCSSDKTFEIMQEMLQCYAGPHRVLLRQNSVNLGLIKHVNMVMPLVKSDYIVAGAGDDISEPERVAEVCHVLSSKPLLIHSGFVVINRMGEMLTTATITEHLLTRDIRKIAQSCSLYVGATGAWHKDLFRIFGDISQFEAYEDLVLGYRAALLERISYISKPLIRYRVGVGLSTSKPNSLKKKMQSIHSNIASLRQRQIDTLLVAPERGDLVTGIERAIDIQKGLAALYSMRISELFLMLTRPWVFAFFVNYALRKFIRIN